MDKSALIKWRSGVLFVVGIAGIAYETLVSQTDRPTLLITFGAMLGLPLFLKVDEKVKYQTPAPPYLREPEDKS